MPASLASDWNIAPLNGLAQVKGRTDAALSNAPIHRFLLEAVQRFADRPAVVFREQGIRWTWAQLQAEVDALAAGFIALGLRVGDRVGIWSPNRAEWLVTQFATARAGLVLVNINPAYRIAELEYALNLSGCRALVTAEQLKTSKYLEMLQRLAPELVSCAPGALKAARMPALEMVIRLGDARTPGMLNYGDVLAQGRTVVDV
ncbi:MAG: AMP-binding protein, partial [Nitrospirota bacterium]